ncbi:unnamed protein product [Ectocarpus fasciculatus]
MGTFLLAYFLGRCARLAWIVFVEIVRTMWEVKMRALPRPPAPVLRDNDMEGGPANVAEPAPGVPVLGDNDVEGAPANLVAPGALELGANDVEGAPANSVESAPSAPVLADNDADGAPANLAITAAVFGVGLPLGLGPPAPLPSRSISAPERLISTPVAAAVTAASGISGDVSSAALVSAAPTFSAASRGRASTIGHQLSVGEEFCATV